VKGDGFSIGNNFADRQTLVQVEPGSRRMLDPGLSFQPVQGGLNLDLQTIMETVFLCTFGTSQHAHC
jgi:hypothetical protein